jgi:hypothetical protein
MPTSWPSAFDRYLLSSINHRYHNSANHIDPGRAFGLSSLMDTPKRLAAGLMCIVEPLQGHLLLQVSSGAYRIHWERTLQPVCRSFLVKTIITLQGAYIILQSLSLKIALQKCRCFSPGHVHISLHCMVAGSKMPCNALRSFYEMKPSSADFQKGTV